MNTENCYNPLDIFSAAEYYAKTLCYEFPRYSVDHGKCGERDWKYYPRAGYSVRNCFVPYFCK
jgi:hypothetical protein